MVPADFDIEIFIFIREGFLDSALQIVRLLFSKVEGLSEDIFHHGSVVVIGKSKGGVFSVEVNEDNDIIIGMKAGALSQFLDSIHDFSGSTSLSHSFILSDIQKNLDVSFTTEFVVFKETFLLQKKLNSQMFSSKFVTVNNKLVVSQEFLGISISQTLKSFSHI